MSSLSLTFWSMFHFHLTYSYHCVKTQKRLNNIFVSLLSLTFWSMFHFHLTYSHQYASICLNWGFICFGDVSSLSLIWSEHHIYVSFSSHIFASMRQDVSAEDLFFSSLSLGYFVSFSSHIFVDVSTENTFADCLFTFSWIFWHAHQIPFSSYIFLQAPRCFNRILFCSVAIFFFKFPFSLV